MKRFLSKVKYFAVLLAALVLVSSCQKQGDGVIPEKPVLPSSESLIMNEDLFEEGQASAQRLQTRNNFGLATISAAIWTGAVNLYTIKPRLGFHAVIQADNAVYDEEREAWVWTAEFTHMTINHVAQLVAKPDGDEVNWEMWITAEGNAEFLWFDGVTTVDAKHATWNLRKNDGSNAIYMTVEYNKDVEAGTVNLRYSNEAAGYIYYGVDMNADYNVFYDIYNSNENKLFQIKWNSTDKSGFIVDPEGVKHCWDTNLEDVACS